MSDLVYRNKDNMPCDLQAWQNEKGKENIAQVILTTKGKSVVINKQYFGTVGSVYKVWIDCSSDLTEYYGYIKHYDGEIEADSDFQRLNDEISKGAEIYEKELKQEKFAITFDVRYKKHIVVDARAYPTIQYLYDNRSEAEKKYNELISGKK